MLLMLLMRFPPPNPPFPKPRFAANALVFPKLRKLPVPGRPPTPAIGERAPAPDSDPKPARPVMGPRAPARFPAPPKLRGAPLRFRAPALRFRAPARLPG